MQQTSQPQPQPAQQHNQAPAQQGEQQPQQQQQYPPDEVELLDLEQELVTELKWSPEFAEGARRQYLRWLQLKQGNCDFQTALLAPSNIVAHVWFVHRQWTLDYMATCESLGAFVHHFPDAARDVEGHKVAYQRTLSAYRDRFGTPPAEYWPSSPSQERIPPPCLTPPVPLASSSTGMPSSAERARTAALMANKTPAAATNQVRSPAPAAATANAAATGIVKRGPGRPKKSESSGNTQERQIPFSASMYLKGLALKPLPPGEKRRRGRPRESDYIAIDKLPLALQEKARQEAEAALAQHNLPDLATTSANAKAAAAAAASGSKSKSKLPDLATLPVLSALPRKPGTPPAPGRRTRGRPPRRASDGDKPSSTTNVSMASGNGETAHKNTGANVLGNEPKGGAATAEPPLKRPRGRPRRDGSWPVSKKQQGAMMSSNVQTAAKVTQTANNNSVTTNGCARKPVAIAAVAAASTTTAHSANGLSSGAQKNVEVTIENGAAAKVNTTIAANDSIKSGPPMLSRTVAGLGNEEKQDKTIMGNEDSGQKSMAIAAKSHATANNNSNEGRADCEEDAGAGYGSGSRSSQMAIGNGDVARA